MLFHEANGSLAVQAPAKLNLFLEILGKRSDGFHELETLMVTVDWYDTLVVRDQPGPIRLMCRQAGQRSDDGGSGIPTGDDNLVVRAARLLKESTGHSGGAEIHLVKRIPMAAGLAGGSSDAAATLWALNRTWRTGLTNEELRELAAKLGSDIPFFLADRPAAVCRGRGEQVEPAPLPAGLCFVIARPSGGLSTALVYRHCRPSPHPRTAGDLVRKFQSGRLQDAGSLLHNALQEPAERLSPEVSQLKSLFSQQPVMGHLMSGSGTAYFGLCSHRRQALQIAARLRAAGVPHVAVVQTRS